MSSRERNILLVVTSLYLLHLLRNLISVYVLLPPFAALAAAAYFVYKNKISFDGNGVFSLFCFSVISVLPVFYSFLWYPEEEYLVSYSRYFYMVPLAIFFAVAVSEAKALELTLKAFAVLVVFGGLSVFYQLFYGPISWFAETSGRDGLVRYASLVGSLTAYGIFAVFAIPIISLLFQGFFIRYFFLIIVITSMLLTLQKAAVMNILVVFFLSFMIESNRFRLVLVTLFILATIFVFLAFFFEVPYVVATINNVFRLRGDLSSAGFSDVTVFQSVLDRLWELPSVLFERHGVQGMLYGVGMVGGSGTLGFIDYPMAHNGFFDLLFIGGIFNLIAFILLFVFVFFRVRRVALGFCGNSDLLLRVNKVTLYIIFLFVLNFMFSGVLYFQPFGGVIFYAVVTFYCLHVNRYKLN